jgi:hypothetical protein
VDPWTLSHKADPYGAKLADGHYSRRTVGSPQFMPPGETVVLVAPGAVFGWWRPHPRSGLRSLNGLDGWTCTLFRRLPGGGSERERSDPRRSGAGRQDMWTRRFVDIRAPGQDPQHQPGVLLPARGVPGDRVRREADQAAFVETLGAPPGGGVRVVSTVGAAGEGLSMIVEMKRLDLDGQIDEKGIRFIGEAIQRPNGTWVCLADVLGCLCLVEVTVRAARAMASAPQGKAERHG